MDVLVCFKVVPDLDMLTGSDWVVDSHFQVNTGFVKTMINPYDESALEMALKLSDAAMKNNQDVTLTALTIGAARHHKLLKNLLALKYHHVVQIECNGDIRFNAPGISRIIYQYIHNIHAQQVIVLGSQSSEGDNAKTALLVAERLGIPCITSVTGIRLSKRRDCLDITSRIEDMVIEQTVKPPVVLVIGNVPNSYIRVPTLKDKMQCAKKEIEVYILEDLGMNEREMEAEKDMELIQLFYEKKEKTCLFIPGENAAGKAEALYKDYLKERFRR